MSRKTVLLSVMVLAALTASSYALPTVDELFKQMAARFGEQKTFEADLAMSGQSLLGAISGTGHMATQVTVKDGVKVHKMCNTMNMTIKKEDQEQKMQVKMVSDGEFVWNETRNPQMPDVQVTKMKANQNMPGRLAPDPDPALRLKEMKTDFDLKVTGEDTIDGQKMYVLEGTPKKDAPQALDQVSKVRIRIYFNEKDLTLRRIVNLDADGKEIATMDLTNTRYNHPISADMFKYTPPPGAEVIDMTKDIGGAPEGGE